MNFEISFTFDLAKIPDIGYTFKTHASFGGVAQLVEHLLCKQGVIGSNPFTSTIFKKA
jgi:hypothetical protein